MDPAAMGSLKTRTMTELSGTSRFCGGGLARTTTGCRAAATGSTVWRSTRPAASRTKTSTVSPSNACSGTGSKPPLPSGVVTEETEDNSRTVAMTPSGSVVGASDTYTTLSPAAAAVRTLGPSRAAPLSGAARMGLETNRPWGSGSHLSQPGSGLPGLSEHAVATASRQARAHPLVRIRPPCRHPQVLGTVTAGPCRSEYQRQTVAR